MRKFLVIAMLSLVVGCAGVAEEPVQAVTAAPVVPAPPTPLTYTQGQLDCIEEIATWLEAMAMDSNAVFALNRHYGPDHPYTGATMGLYATYVDLLDRGHGVEAASARITLDLIEFCEE